MVRNAVYSALAAILMSTGAFADTDDKIKEIEVQVDLTALLNPAAATRYANLAADLQGALAARLTDRFADDGMRISVDLSEFELSNSFQESLGLADTTLVGDVKITDETDNSNFEAYELTVNIEQARPFFPVGVDFATQTASSEDYYQAMIAAFADALVKRLDD